MSVDNSSSGVFMNFVLGSAANIDLSPTTTLYYGDRCVPAAALARAMQSCLRAVHGSPIAAECCLTQAHPHPPFPNLRNCSFDASSAQSVCVVPPCTSDWLLSCPNGANSPKTGSTVTFTNGGTSASDVNWAGQTTTIDCTLTLTLTDGARKCGRDQKALATPVTRVRTSGAPFAAPTACMHTPLLKAVPGLQLAPPPPSLFLQQSPETPQRPRRCRCAWAVPWVGCMELSAEEKTGTRSCAYTCADANANPHRCVE